MKSTRMFNGKNYRIKRIGVVKKDLIKRKKNLQDKGYSVRLIFTGYAYKLYARRKK